MQLTKDIIKRVESKQTQLKDPCVICGVTFNDCPHDMGETMAVIKQAKALTRGQRALIMGQK